MDWVEAEIEHRTDNAKRLAARFADLRGLDYKDFLMRLMDEGLDLDFVTSIELHKAVNA